jgi:hypothetical protein
VQRFLRSAFWHTISAQTANASSQPPVRMDIGADAESGRGLLLVEAVSHGWGWYPAPDGRKVVWALAILPMSADRAR